MSDACQICYVSFYSLQPTTTLQPQAYCHLRQKIQKGHVWSRLLSNIWLQPINHATLGNHKQHIIGIQEGQATPDARGVLWKTTALINWFHHIS